MMMIIIITIASKYDLYLKSEINIYLMLCEFNQCRILCMYPLACKYSCIVKIDNFLFHTILYYNLCIIYLYQVREIFGLYHITAQHNTKLSSMTYLHHLSIYTSYGTPLIVCKSSE